jgi:DNA (cytosine-5)-methyltransferase 1
MERSYPSPRPTVVDFFCGAGGLSLGLEQAGFDIVLGVDQDGHHIATHERNFPYGHSLCGSIVDLTGQSIRNLIGLDEIDVIVGGPPCQGFSHMGLRDLKDPRNGLVAQYMRLVLELRPKAFAMENVPGMISGDTRRVLDDVIELAESNGYRITKPVKILDASDFGVPQKRKRLFLLGLREDIGGTIEYPTGLCIGQPARPTVLEAIGDLPYVEDNPRLFHESSTPYDKDPKSLYAAVARGSKDDPSDLSRPRAWDNLLCSGCLRVNHSASSVGLYRDTPPGQTVPGHKLPRLSPTGIAPTLRAGSDSTHGSHTAPRPIHPVFPRCITAREAARLHGFPDWFSFYPLKWHAYRQIGNAVCPPVARALGAQILKALSPKLSRRRPKPIVLGSTFTLPEERLRSLRRIPILREFPPVVAHLFAEAYDSNSHQLKKRTFTFSDVKNAISKTGVDLHWVREDTFLQEIARSRSVKKILSAVEKEGYSIRAATLGEAIGEFVPLGTPGTLDDKESVPIRIDSIRNAFRVRISSKEAAVDSAFVNSLLKKKAVRERIWGLDSLVTTKRPLSLAVERQDSTILAHDIVIQVGKSAQPEDGLLISCKASNAITKSRMARLGITHKCKDITVFIAATSRHVLSVRYMLQGTTMTEVCRAAFEIIGKQAPTGVDE